MVKRFDYKKIKLLILGVIIIVSALCVVSGLYYTRANNVEATLNESRDVREIVFNKLPEYAAKGLSPWTDGTVEVAVLDDKLVGYHSIKDKSYNGKEIYVVYYYFKHMIMPSGIYVYVSKDDKYKIIDIPAVD